MEIVSLVEASDPIILPSLWSPGADLRKIFLRWNMSKLVDVVNNKYKNQNVEKLPKFQTGDTIAVSLRIQEGNKSRVQIFTGTCIAMKNANSINGHFRVRKISDGVGVEKVIPFHSPKLEGIKIVNRGKARKSKLYYLRDKVGKASRVKIDYERK
jgi:large subunit ribosomal protein L19